VPSQVIDRNAIFTPLSPIRSDW